MDCPACGHSNENGRRFCSRCGDPLGARCPSCGAATKRDDRFCGQCGASLDLAAGGASARGPRPESSERRQLTVLFCDIVGATRIAQDRDPEDWQGLLRVYRATCTGAVARFGGHVAQLLGDGMLVYFGFPRALENSPDRAAHAALAILEAMAEANARIERTGGPQLAVRIGIHTGSVVVGSEVTEGEALAIGDTPNLAARLQDEALPDTIVVSDVTRRLLGDDLDIEDWGERQLKGLVQPVRIHRVVAARRGDPDEPGARDRTPLVGRAREIELLLDRFERAREGEGQLVTISAEPGLGKSRLVRALRPELAGTPHRWILARCSPYEQNSFLASLLPWFTSTLGWEDTDAPGQRLSKLEQALRSRGCSPEAVVPIVAPVLSIGLPADYTPPSPNSEQRYRQALETLARYLTATALEQPAVVIFEDLHWADPSTLVLLEQLMPLLRSARVLLVLTYRPDFEPPWRLPSESTPIVLARITRRDAGVLVAQIAEAAGKVLANATVEQIARRGEGVPLFLEELTKALIDASGDAVPGEVGEWIPASLQDSLAARLDRLGEARAVAQLAAVLGREFSYELLEAVAELDSASLDRALIELSDAELILPAGPPPRTSYSFKHALLHDAAYESLLRGRRRELHHLVADALESRFPKLVSAQPELVAHHCTRAGEVRRAIDLWKRAAARARASFANEEAVAHTRSALHGVLELPESLERDDEELSLQLSLGAGLIASRGMGAADVEPPHLRARDLASRRNRAKETFAASASLVAHYTTRSRHESARAIAQEMIELSAAGEDRRGSAMSHALLSASLLWCGEIDRAVQHTEQALGYFGKVDPLRVRASGTNPMVVCFGQRALLLWCLGQPDLALSEAQRLVEHALESPASLAWALNFKTQIHLYRREPEPLARSAAELCLLADAHEFHRHRAWGVSLGACAGILGADVEASCAALEAALGEYGEEEAGFWRALCFSFLAIGYGRLGDRRRALERLHHAQQHAAQTGEAFFEADLFRIEGDLHRTTPGSGSEAEQCYRRAVAHARGHRALCFELRAATALTSLLREQGREAEFRPDLLRCYQRFEEGHATRDLCEARALLDATAPARSEGTTR